jgi:hypothetical protein
MKNFGKIVLVINLVLVDAVVAYLFYWFIIQPQSNSTSTSLEEFKQNVSSNDTCGSECQKYINERVAAAVGVPTVGLTPTKTEAKVVSSPRSKVKNVSYLPIPGSGSTLKNDWTTISGTDFYMSKGDYQGLTGVYFEANIKLVNGNGLAYVRLYDVTHFIAVNASELSTSSQTSTVLTTGAISLWEGYNHYVVQAKSLTADTSVYESGRLKIITEN